MLSQSVVLITKCSLLNTCQLCLSTNNNQDALRKVDNFLGDTALEFLGSLTVSGTSLLKILLHFTALDVNTNILLTKHITQ